MPTIVLQWDFDAWNDYLYWQEQDRKTLKKLNALIQDVQRNPFSGTGKPEPLKGNLRGLWSRRIDDANRLVYLVDGNKIVIFSCRGHYN